MRKLFARWIITSLALVAAAWIVPGITVDRNAWWVYALMAVILGFVNAIIRPILKFFSFPLLILTLGLFTFVINGLTLWITSSIAVSLGIGFRINGFSSAFLGALIVSIVSWFLSAVFTDDNKD